MIKNYLLSLVVLLILSTSLMAQEKWIPDIGLRINSNKSSINFRDVNGSNAELLPKKTVGLGAVFSWQVGPRTQISFEPGFIQAGSESYIERTVWVERQDTTLDISLNYLNIPVFVRYNRFDNRRFNPFIEAGFHLDHFRSYSIENARAPRLDEALSEANPNKLAISFGFGYNNLVFLEQDVSVGLRVYRDISPTWSDDERKFIKQRNVQFYLRVALSSEKIFSKFLKKENS